MLFFACNSVGLCQRFIRVLSPFPIYGPLPFVSLSSGAYALGISQTGLSMSNGWGAVSLISGLACTLCRHPARASAGESLALQSNVGSRRYSFGNLS